MLKSGDRIGYYLGRIKQVTEGMAEKLAAV